MREIRPSGSVRGVRRKPYPYRDPILPVQSTVNFAPAQHTHWGLSLRPELHSSELKASGLILDAFDVLRVNFCQPIILIEPKFY